MKKSATSKEELLAIAKEIAGREGIGNLNIRRLASESGIAIGTVYNYYPSKGDLVGAVMEDFWRNVFHGSHFDTESGDFIGSIHDIYFRLHENLESFREEFLQEMEVLSQTDQKRGRELEAFYLGHMNEGRAAPYSGARQQGGAGGLERDIYTPEVRILRLLQYGFSPEKSGGSGLF